MPKTKVQFTAQELEVIEEIKRHSYLDPRFDIRATTAEGRAVNIEMQKVMPTHFADRILLQHSAFLLQAKYEYDREYMSDFPIDPTEEQRAERVARRYKIPPTYAVWICDFKVPHQRAYHDVWRVTNGEGLTVTDKIKYILIDLTQFSASEDELDCDEKRWLYLLKHAGNQEVLPEFEDEVFIRALRRIHVEKANAKLLKDQANNMMTDDEKLDFIAYHKVKARREGRSEGLADVAKRMLSKGMPIAEISDMTGLKTEEISALLS